MSFLRTATLVPARVSGMAIFSARMWTSNTIAVWGTFVLLVQGVMMSSLVKIGARVKFGTGIFIEPKLVVGSDSIIGSGAILTRDIPHNSIVKTKINYSIRSRA